MGYVDELRALVGTRPLILLRAAVIVQDEAGRLLLQRRGDNAKWSLPGETLEARFFHPSALPDDLNPPDRAILARFGQGG